MISYVQSKEQNEQKKSQTHTENKELVAREEGVWGKREGSKKYKLLVTK